MTKLYYSFISKIIRDHKRMYKCIPQMLIIGDERQCIFAFNGSDSRCVY
jgi:ATP-dependent exoDNAse (exonuclease V) beta subunit